MPIIDPIEYSKLTTAQKYLYNDAQANPTVDTTTNLPLVNPNASMQVVKADPIPVTSLSSQAGKDVLNTNTQKLTSIEQAYNNPSLVDYLNAGGKASDFQSREQLAKNAGINNYTGTAEQNTQLLNLLRSPSASPVMKTMVDELNNVAKSGKMTANEQSGLNNLQTKQDEITTAAANARSALERRDYTSMDYWTSKANAAKADYEKQITDYFTSVKDLRQQLTKNLTPTEKEQQLKQQLVDLRSQAEQFNLQTEKDKMAEYEGQTLGFARGRAEAIDFKASFAKQEMALKEKNLLLSLGLEQEARKMSKETIEKQLEYLANDYEAQSKIQDKITKAEDDLFDKAQNLSGDAQKALLDFIDSLSGINPDTMPEDAKNNLETMAARAGLDISLVNQALKTAYQKETFDQAMKRAQETRLSSQSVDKPLSILDVARYNEQFPGAGVTAGDTQTTADNKVKSVSTPEGALTVAITENKNSNISYTDTLKEIESNENIVDKELARSVAQKVYGIKQYSTEMPVKKTDLVNSVNSFFTNLFGD